MATMTRQAAIETLEADYQAKVNELARELRAIPVPGSEARDRVSSAFEERCLEVLCATAKDAGLALALSRHTDEAGTDWNDIRGQAALAVALDAAEVAGAQWFLAYHAPLGVVASH